MCTNIRGSGVNARPFPFHCCQRWHQNKTEGPKTWDSHEFQCPFNFHQMLHRAMLQSNWDYLLIQVVLCRYQSEYNPSLSRQEEKRWMELERWRKEPKEDQERVRNGEGKLEGKRFYCDFAQLCLNVYRICCLNTHSDPVWDPTVEFTQSMYFCAPQTPSVCIQSPAAQKHMSHKWLAKAGPLIKQHVV